VTLDPLPSHPRPPRPRPRPWGTPSPSPLAAPPLDLSGACQPPAQAPLAMRSPLVLPLRRSAPPSAADRACDPRLRSRRRSLRSVAHPRGPPHPEADLCPRSPVCPHPLRRRRPRGALPGARRPRRRPLPLRRGGVRRCPHTGQGARRRAATLTLSLPSPGPLRPPFTLTLTIRRHHSRSEASARQPARRAARRRGEAHRLAGGRQARRVSSP
jgi:hypothetical protein